jgi:hypothetical protein
MERLPIELQEDIYKRVYQLYFDNVVMEVHEGYKCFMRRKFEDIIKFLRTYMFNNDLYTDDELLDIGMSMFHIPRS